MRFKGETFISLCLTGVAVGVVTKALKWPLKASLFPITVGTGLFFMTVAMVLLDMLGGKEDRGKELTMDFSFSKDIDRTLVIRRTLLTCLWIFGFSMLILFLGFPIAIPLFLLLNLKLQAREGWRVSLLLTGSVWGFFFGLFIWLLDMPFQEGLILRWLGGIG